MKEKKRSCVREGERQREGERERENEREKGRASKSYRDGGRNRNDGDGTWSTIRPCIDRQIM